MSENMQSLMALLGPLLGAGVGSWFGIRGALNGIKERAERIERTVGEVRDTVRDSQHELHEMRKDLT